MIKIKQFLHFGLLYLKKLIVSLTKFTQFLLRLKSGKQRSILKDKDSDRFSLGVAAFYLNRTNRSGILSAGVMGGKNQEGKWKLDARFNRNSLAKRIGNLLIFN